MADAEIVFSDVEEELRSATAKHGAIHSTHEGYGVIMEEIEEFWEEARRKHPDPEKIYDELVQVAAMAIRTIMDVT